MPENEELDLQDTLAGLLVADAAAGFRQSRPDIRTIFESTPSDWELAGGRLLANAEVMSRLVLSTQTADRRYAQFQLRGLVTAVSQGLGGKFSLLVSLHRRPEEHVRALCQVITPGWDDAEKLFGVLEQVGKKVAGQAGRNEGRWWEEVPVFANFSAGPGVTHIMAELAREIREGAASPGTQPDARLALTPPPPPVTEVGLPGTLEPPTLTREDIKRVIEKLGPDTRCLLALTSSASFFFPVGLSFLNALVREGADDGQRAISSAVRGLEEEPGKVVNYILNHAAVLSDQGLLELGRKVGLPPWNEQHPGDNVAGWITRLYTDLSSLENALTPEERGDLNALFASTWEHMVYDQGSPFFDPRVPDWKPEYVFAPDQFGPYMAKFFQWLERELEKKGVSLRSSGLSAEFLQKVGIPVNEGEFDPGALAF